MSLRVLVIPEDPTHNGYILKPLVEALLADVGRPRAQVTVLVNPRLRGYDHAVRAIRADLAARYGHWDLWLFFPDADRATPGQMQSLESDLRLKGVTLLCCPAEPEVEIFACTAWLKDLAVPWERARTHASFKEDVFAHLLALHGDPRRAGAGRDLLIDACVANFPLLLRLCPELQDLRKRLAAALGTD